MGKYISTIKRIAEEIRRNYKLYGVDDDHHIVLQNDDTGEVLVLNKDFEYHSNAVRVLYADINLHAADKESATNAKQAYQKAICQKLENHFTKEIMALFGAAV